MTRILAIEGTDIRLEIENCHDCPILGEYDERGLYYTCGITKETDIGGPGLLKCPLPEKTDG